MSALASLWKLYLPLIGWIGLGLMLGYQLPRSVPLQLGKFLFWIGVPFSIMAFLRRADLSASIWMAPIAAWIALLIGAALAWGWIQLQNRSDRSPSNGENRLNTAPSQGSFLLSAMVGNTGYLGYPIALALVGPQYFGWAVFYDTLGSTLGAYGLGVVLAAHFGRKAANGQFFFRSHTQSRFVELLDRARTTAVQFTKFNRARLAGSRLDDRSFIAAVVRHAIESDPVLATSAPSCS